MIVNVTNKPFNQSYAMHNDLIGSRRLFNGVKCVFQFIGDLPKLINLPSSSSHITVSTHIQGLR